MHLPPPYADPHEPLDPSTLEDLFNCCRNTVRVEILLCLAAGELSVDELCAMLRYARPHVSNHLRVLRGAKLVGLHQQKKRHLYGISPALLVSRDSTGLRLALKADNGSSVDAQISEQDPIMRALSAAALTRLGRRPSPVVVVPGAAAPDPGNGVTMSTRHASGPR